VGAASDGEGYGSVFTIQLPIVANRDAVDDAPATVTAGEGSGKLEVLEGIWALVVDDDADAREMMRAVLEGAGARVTTCGSCAEAIGLFSGQGTAALTPNLPDVLIADIAMPEQDGFDLIRSMRLLEPGRGGVVPAIALTADSSDEVRER